MYFLRKPTGELITAENQCFRKIPEQFYDLVQQHFITDLQFETTGFNEGYTLAGGQHLKIGFVIDDRDTPGTPDEPITVAIMHTGTPR